MYESGPVLVVNNVTHKLYVRTFIQGYWSNSRSPITTEINLTSGQATQWNRTVTSYYGTSGSRFYITPEGSMPNGGWASYTATGHVERPNWHHGAEVYFKGNNAGSNRTRASEMGFGELMGD